MQTHLLSQPLPEWGTDSEVFWSLSDTETAAVFVHGFGGHARLTWAGFPELSSSFTKSGSPDIYFYGYESQKIRSQYNAGYLLKFIDTIWTRQEDLQVDSIGRVLIGRSRYNKIIIIAHSLGALVARQMLLGAIADKKEWAKLVELAFYAPAHSGADVLGLIYEGLSPLGFIPIQPLLKLFAPVLADLEPGSETLESVKTETEKLIHEFANLKSKIIIQGDKDRVVQALRFCDDPMPELVSGVGHIEICKPFVIGRRSTEPLERVL